MNPQRLLPGAAARRKGGFSSLGCGGGLLAAVLILAANPTATALQYPTGFVFRPVPNPLSPANTTYPIVAMAQPAVGVQFWDDHFGTIKTRVTQTDGINSRHEYSRFDPFNCDHSMIQLLSSDGGFKIYRTTTMPYNKASQLVRTITEIEEPRWDRENPRLMWGLQEFSIVTLDVVSGVRTVVKDFTRDPVTSPVIAANPVYHITTREEGEPSIDRRYWAFMLQGDERANYEPLYIFCWDRRNNTVVGIYPVAPNDRAIDWVGMSASGAYVLIGGDSYNTGTLTGLVMANRQLTQFHRIGFATGHSDIGVDSDGRDVVVMQNDRTDYIDMIPVDWSTKPILEPGGSYAGTGLVRLVQLYYDSTSSRGFQCGVHISCNFPGWAVISTHIAPGVKEQNWLDRCIVLAELNRTRPRVYYLAKVHNTSQEEPRAYWEETHATITNDGRKVVWASNWGLNVGQEQMSLIQLTMPDYWYRYKTAAQSWPGYR
ncbi:MAG: hypothetical protein N3D11_11370 [Candidatus Sumerlaeia bacterium]|nr:hypothetical protein [Candidatus Sumerlaeia bacterium]